MKILFSRRVLGALLMLGVLTAAISSTAMAGNGYRYGNGYGYGIGYEYGNGYGHARRSWLPIVRTERVAFVGDFGWRGGRSAPRGAECAVVNHPPHRWFDGRLYCAGQNPDGSWRNPAYRCEDDFGRKKVDLPGWNPRCEPAPPCN